MVFARELDVARLGNVVCEVTAVVRAEPPVAGTVNDEGGHTNAGQDASDIASELQVEERFRDGWTRGSSE